MAVGDLTREELVELVRRIQSGRAGEAEEDRLVALFQDSVPHPRASDLIFQPERELGPEFRDREAPAELIVETALAYEPFAL